MRIEDQVEGLIDDPPPLDIHIGDAAAAQPCPERLCETRIPVFRRHFLAVGPEPSDVFRAARPPWTSVKPRFTSEDAMLLAQRDQRSREFEQRPVCRLPIEPG